MASKNYGLITDPAELRQLVGQILHDGRPYGFDIETGYLGPDKEKGAIRADTAFVVGISFTDSTDWARYVPLGHDSGDNLDNREVAEIFRPLLYSGWGVAHNAGFELKHLSRWLRRWLPDDDQVRASGGYFPIRSDTMVEAYLAADFERFGLKPLTMLMFNRYGEPVDRSQYLSRIRTIREINNAFKGDEAGRDRELENFDGHIMTELFKLFENLPKNKRKFLRFNTLQTTSRVVEYACEDSAWCLAIHQRYHEEVSTGRTATLLAAEKAIVQDVLPDMEDEGLVYDWPLMQRTAETLTLFRDKFNAEIMAELSTMLDEPIAINLASPPAISKVLYERLGYSTDVYTDKTRDLPPDQRRMSTGKIALERLAKQYPIVHKIREWKKMTRLLGTYLEKYERTYNSTEDGRAHPGYLSAFVITGRFAAVDPPVQQSPKKYHFDLAEAKAAHEAGVEPPPGTCFKFNFRDVIVAPPGWYILGFDLSQAELRAIAGEAQELALLEAFANGEDVHRLTAALMLGIPIEEITEEQRGIGKAQPVDAGIMTPTGPRRMGDLQVGDFVIGSDGFPTKVTGVFPQGVKEIFRVTSSDGASTECCGEHLWTVRNVNTAGAQCITRELRQLVSSGLRRTKNSSQPKYQLPDRQVVHFDPGPALPIDPYVLGALLGDGGFTHSWGPSFGSADRELLDAVRSEHERLGGRWASEAETSPGFRVAYLAAGERYKRGTNQVKDALRDLELWGHRNCDKFVPESYLYASPGDRLALLQGLLDTDGTVQASGALFRVTSRRLAEAAQLIARSLGGWASIKTVAGEKTAYHTKSAPKDQWRVYLRLPGELCPFRLARKVAKWKKPVYQAPQTIVSVEPVGLKQAQCISVAAEDGLYLTESGHYTHNTMNFALLYGMSTKGLADRLGIDIDEAQALMDKYFAGLPAIAAYMTKMKRLGQSQNYVTSRFGRKLPIWEYTSDKRSIRAKGDRACVNYPIQGAATGDYMKIAMIRAVGFLRNAGLAEKVKLVMNVHDALEFYVHSSITPEQVIPILQSAVIFEVEGWPAMQADWHIAKKWGSPTDLVVRPDGSIDYKDTTVEEIVNPVIEQDEDGDEVEVLPEVDVDVLRAAARSDGRRLLVIRLSKMPQMRWWEDFKDYLRDRPGTTSTILETPQGQLELPRTRLSPDDQHMISAVLDDADLQVAYL